MATLDRPGLRWDRSIVSGAGDNDDGERAPRRGAVPPPPDESTDSVRLPRMDPPPSSLEAMVKSRSRAREPKAEASWWPWVVLVLMAAAITGYVMK